MSPLRKARRPPLFKDREQDPPLLKEVGLLVIGKADLPLDGWSSDPGLCSVGDRLPSDLQSLFPSNVYGNVDSSLGWQFEEVEKYEEVVKSPRGDSSTTYSTDHQSSPACPEPVCDKAPMNTSSQRLVTETVLASSPDLSLNAQASSSNSAIQSLSNVTDSRVLEDTLQRQPSSNSSLLTERGYMNHSQGFLLRVHPRRKNRWKSGASM